MDITTVRCTIDTLLPEPSSGIHPRPECAPGVLTGEVGMLVR
jgi:hypothetical protein